MYFNDYFIGKVGKLRQEMQTMNSEQSYSCIKKKSLNFVVSVGEVENVVLNNQ